MSAIGLVLQCTFDNQNVNGDCISSQDNLAIGAGIVNNIFARADIALVHQLANGDSRSCSILDGNCYATGTYTIYSTSPFDPSTAEDWLEGEFDFHADPEFANTGTELDYTPGSSLSGRGYPPNQTAYRIGGSSKSVSFIDPGAVQREENTGLEGGFISRKTMF